jgi:hypothetical protein
VNERERSADLPVGERGEKTVGVRIDGRQVPADDLHQDDLCQAIDDGERAGPARSRLARQRPQRRFEPGNRTDELAPKHDDRRQDPENGAAASIVVFDATADEHRALARTADPDRRAGAAPAGLGADRARVPRCTGRVGQGVGVAVR